MKANMRTFTEPKRLAAILAVLGVAIGVRSAQAIDGFHPDVKSQRRPGRRAREEAFCNRMKMRGIILAFLALLNAGVLSALPTTIRNVTTLQDGGPGSLRECIAASADGDIIEFDVTGTISLQDRPLIIDQNSLTIRGPGKEYLFIDARQRSRVFLIGGYFTNSKNVVVNISGLTIGGGLVAPTLEDRLRGEGPAGGAILLGGGSHLTLSDCLVAGNEVDATFGGQAEGGAIWNEGDLTLLRCEFRNNSAIGQVVTSDRIVYPHAVGGAIYSSGNAFSRLRNPYAGTNRLVIDGCTFVGNVAAGGSAGDNSSAGGNGYGGAIFNYGYLFMTNSTLYANAARGGWSAVDSSDGWFSGEGVGGGLWNNYQAIKGDFGTEYQGIAYLVSCTIHENSAIGNGPTNYRSISGLGHGGGIGGPYGPSLGLFIGNTIVAGNHASPSLPRLVLPRWDEDIGLQWNAPYTVSSMGYNFIGVGDRDNVRPHGWTDTDIVGYLLPPSSIKAALLTWGNNGGPTPTLAPWPQSEVVDSGLNIGSVQYDQRGWTRTYGAGTDRGAVELQPTPAPQSPFYRGPDPLLLRPGGSGSYSIIAPTADFFQWQFNGIDIPGATNSTLVLSNVLPWQAGNYRVLLGNSNEVAISTEATLTLIYALDVATNGDGRVIQIPNQSSYLPGTPATLIATPNSNWVFESWSGDVSSTNNPLTITVSNELSIVANFTFNSDAPALEPISSQKVFEGVPLSFTVTAHNPGGDQLCYSLDSLTGPVPTNATMNPSTGEFLWTPDEAQGPGVFDFIVRAWPTNSPWLLTLQTFTVTVLESNLPPVIATIPDQTVKQGSPLNLTVSATDGDIPANPLLFLLDASAPTNALIDPVSGAFSWTPDESQGPGMYPISVRVTDGSFLNDGQVGLSAIQTFVVTVTVEHNSSNFIVVNTNDSGPGSLREAIADSFDGAVITFTTNLTGAIAVNSELVIGASLTINGPGADRLTLSGNGTNRVFVVENGNVEISDLTIANGYSTTNGGAIWNDGLLSLDKCAFVGNHTEAAGGAIWNAGSLQVKASTFAGNTAIDQGGAIAEAGLSLRLINSTFCSNSTPNWGGAISTSYGSSDVTIQSCTLADNRAGDGGAIFACYEPFTGIPCAHALALANCIVAGNSANYGPDLFGGVTSLGYNLIGRADYFTQGVGSVGDQVGSMAFPIEAGLGPLQDNGGPTPTMALLPGSPAIDQGNSGGLTTDQRAGRRPMDHPGVPRAIGGDGSDIGAYERESLLRITDISLLSGAAVQINFQSEEGDAYALQYTPDLWTGGWATLINDIAGTGGIVGVMDTDPPQPQRFYRMVLQP